MTDALGERARSVLSRFPAHLDVARSGKQIAHVVDAIATDFESFASQVAGVRDAHRLSRAPTLRDLALLGALHGIGDDDLGLVAVKAERLQALGDAMRQAIPAGGDALLAAANALLDALGIDGADERLAMLAPAGAAGAPPDLAAAATALLDGLRDDVGFDAVLEATRRRIADICALHAGGNGTVRATLLAALSALDLEPDTIVNEDVRARLIAEGRTSGLDLSIHDEFFHSADHFWHSTYVRDTLPLAVEIGVTLPDATVLMGDTIAVAVLAQRSGVQVARLLDRAAAAGHVDPVPRTRVTLADADAIGALDGFTVQRVRRGTLELTGDITRAAIGIRLGVPEPDVARTVETVAGVAPAPDPLSPQLAAVVARKYGYRTVLRPAQKLLALGIEENPLRRERRDPVDCVHAQMFTVRRRGFGRRQLRVEIDGVEDRTLGPMLVNRDEGRGIGLYGPVPDGSKLLFTEEGLVFVDGADASGRAYSWSGACFADDVPNAHDFLFDGPGVPARRRATFVTVVPDGAVDREALVPHASAFLDEPGVNVGETRFAYFVQQAHLGFRSPTNTPDDDLAPAPRTVIAFADESVLATDDPSTEPVAGRVTLSWLEHEGYAVRVIIPSRFTYLADPDGPSVEARLLRALERIRPAGVAFRVEFADDRWTLGSGSLTDEEPLDDDPNDLLRGGTVLWAEGDVT
jgi:hypothetical protein